MKKHDEIKTFKATVLFSCHGEGVIYVLAMNPDQALQDTRKLLAASNPDKVPALIEGSYDSDITDAQVIDVTEVDSE